MAIRDYVKRKSRKEFSRKCSVRKLLYEVSKRVGVEKASGVRASVVVALDQMISQGYLIASPRMSVLQALEYGLDQWVWCPRRGTIPEEAMWGNGVNRNGCYRPGGIGRFMLGMVSRWS